MRRVTLGIAGSVLAMTLGGCSEPAPQDEAVPAPRNSEQFNSMKTQLDKSVKSDTHTKKPVEGEAEAAKPAETKPAASKPAETKAAPAPAVSKAAETKPAATETKTTEKKP